MELEELRGSLTNILNDKEQACEKHIIKTIKLLSAGQFNTQFPFKLSLELLGDIHTQAERRFYALKKG